MLFVKKLNFSKDEIDALIDGLDGYVWVVVDIKKNMIAAGDEYVGNMKRALLKKRCSVHDIFGVGFDLMTGEIDYRSEANVKWMDEGSNRDVPRDKRERVETLMRYFFLELPVFKVEGSGPRYSKKG